MTLHTKVVTAHDSKDLIERLFSTVLPIVAISGAIAEKAFSSPENNAPITNSMIDSRGLGERIEKEVLR